MNQVPFSKCCGAVMRVGGEGTTHYYVCTQCGNPCGAKEIPIGTVTTHKEVSKPDLVSVGGQIVPVEVLEASAEAMDKVHGKPDWEAFDKFRAEVHVSSDGMVKENIDDLLRLVERTLSSHEASTRKAEREVTKDIIAKHNARILNAFQRQGTADMPLIAYDERVCLIPAMEIATKETLDSLTDKIKQRV